MEGPSLRASRLQRDKVTHPGALPRARCALTGARRPRDSDAGRCRRRRRLGPSTSASYPARAGGGAGDRRITWARAHMRGGAAPPPSVWASGAGPQAPALRPSEGRGAPAPGLGGAEVIRPFSVFRLSPPCGSLVGACARDWALRRRSCREEPEWAQKGPKDRAAYPTPASNEKQKPLRGDWGSRVPRPRLWCSRGTRAEPCLSLPTKGKPAKLGRLCPSWLVPVAPFSPSARCRVRALAWALMHIYTRRCGLVHACRLVCVGGVCAHRQFAGV